MKILILPDIHGRAFWKKPTEDMSKWDKVIFLGDYLDPYGGEATPKEALSNFKEIIGLAEAYKDKVVLLYGNHDLPYWCEPYKEEVSYWCRHDYDNDNEIESIFLQHNYLFTWAWQYKNFLFTHAGVTNKYAEILGIEINAEKINDFFSSEENQKKLAIVSWERGGIDSTGSIVWADVRDHYGHTPNKYIKDLFQIFGHTYLSRYIKTDNFAMLDCGGTPFILEDNVLTNINGDKLVNT